MNPVIKILEDLLTLGLEKFGLYYSQYRGYVQSNTDPLNLGRLQLNIPEVYGDSPSSYWAWPANNYAGPGYGMQVLPQPNDLVWVSFEKGNPRKPIWHFGYFTKGEKPSELVDPNIYWFRTPKGLTVKLDDNTEKITIFHKTGGTIRSAVLGEVLKSKVESLIDILLTATTNTGIGPQPFLPTTLDSLTQLRAEINEILSEVNQLN
jgi:hypothetical protein